MNKDEVVKTLKMIFHSVAPEIEFEKIDFKKSLRGQVEIDSIDFYNILVQIHKQTGVNIPDSKLLELKNPEELIDFIILQSSHRPLSELHP